MTAPIEFVMVRLTGPREEDVFVRIDAIVAVYTMRDMVKDSTFIALANEERMQVVETPAEVVEHMQEAARAWAELAP
jgi:predicted Rossmann-fold nucleotide-binding protein